MGIEVSVITLVLACYLAYTLAFRCTSHNDGATKTQKIPILKETIQKELRTNKHSKLKRRVTAIRTGTHKGLYDKGVLVDNLDKSVEYEVQELATSRDRMYYKLNFFNSDLDFLEACEVSKKVDNFKRYISEELY